MYTGRYSCPGRLYDAIMKENAVCVVGNGQTIEENKEMFGTIENLFH